MGVHVLLDPESVARYAALLADRSRAAMCLALMDGRAWTAGELARAAGIAAPTATEHLNILVGAGLLAEQRQGRHRYVRLASAETARLLESLSVAAGQPGAGQVAADGAGCRGPGRGPDVLRPSGR